MRVTLHLAHIVRRSAIRQLALTRCQVLLAVDARLMEATLQFVLLTLRLQVLPLVFQVVFVVDIAHHILLYQLVVV